jgi:hypothetical protein
VITFVTCLFDGKSFGVPHTNDVYDGSWVDKLYRGLDRNTTNAFELVCLVDRQYKMLPSIKQVPFYEQSNSVAGWSILAEMYRPDLASGQRCTIGLDTIILKNIDDVVSFNGNMGLVSDPFSHEPWVSKYPWFKDEVCNAISISSKLSSDKVWDVWTNRKQWVYENCILPSHGTLSEMVLLRKMFNADKRCAKLDYIYPGKIFSYKCDILIQPELIHDASIIYFHGNIKPHNLSSSVLDQTIKDNWI